MRKNKDYRTSEEKIGGFIYKNRKKIIIFSFVIALIIFMISLFILNKGGLFVIIFYPLALLGFIFDLRIENRGPKAIIRFGFSIFMIFMAILFFVLGFFINI